MIFPEILLNRVEVLNKLIRKFIWVCENRKNSNLDCSCCKRVLSFHKEILGFIFPMSFEYYISKDFSIFIGM